MIMDIRTTPGDTPHKKRKRSFSHGEEAWHLKDVFSPRHALRSLADDEFAMGESFVEGLGPYKGQLWTRCPEGRVFVLPPSHPYFPSTIEWRDPGPPFCREERLASLSPSAKHLLETHLERCNLCDDDDTVEVYPFACLSISNTNVSLTAISSMVRYHNLMVELATP